MIGVCTEERIKEVEPGSQSSERSMSGGVFCLPMPSSPFAVTGHPFLRVEGDLLPVDVVEKVIRLSGDEPFHFILQGLLLTLAYLVILLPPTVREELRVLRNHRCAGLARA
jgi:hypothetical protein